MKKYQVMVAINIALTILSGKAVALSKCNVDGKTIYQDSPCPSQTETRYFGGAVTIENSERARREAENKKIVLDEKQKQQRSRPVVFVGGNKMVVIAPSLSTETKAREIMYRNGWLESNLREADGILVVMRSNLRSPLLFLYDRFEDLKRDAELQLDISGDEFHIYLFKIEDDLQLTQLEYTHYKAK